jgi:hypothetical protein
MQCQYLDTYRVEPGRAALHSCVGYGIVSFGRRYTILMLQVSILLLYHCFCWLAISEILLLLDDFRWM